MTAKETLHLFLLGFDSCNDTTKYDQTDLKKEKLTLTTWEEKNNTPKKSSVQHYNMTLFEHVLQLCPEYFPEMKVTLRSGELSSFRLCAFTLL